MTKGDKANRKILADLLRGFADILEKKSTILEPGWSVSKDWLYDEVSEITAPWPVTRKDWARKSNRCAVISLEGVRFTFKESP
jgi:hypothetical protein